MSPTPLKRKKINIIAAPTKIPSSANTGIGSFEKAIPPDTWWKSANRTEKSIAAIETVSGTK